MIQKARLRFSLLLMTSLWVLSAPPLQAASTDHTERRPVQGFPRAETAPPVTGKKPLPSFASDRLVVKLKESATPSAQLLFDQQAASGNDDSPLAHLNQKFQVMNITPVFRVSADEKQPKTRQERKKQLEDLFQRSKARHAKRASRGSQSSAIPDLSGIYILTVPEGTDILAACKSYAANPEVEYATPSYAMEPQSSVNDPYFSSRGSWGNSYDDMWALKRIQADLAWDTAQGEGVVVAVVDTGVDYNHIDLAANIWTNPSELTGAQGADDDGNGYTDDIRGWHFERSYASYSDSDVMDTDGHGTYVAGIIGAVGNNGTGIVGVAPKAKIMPVKIMANDGFNLSDAYSNGILYAAHNGADVINLSWGCSDCTNSAGNPMVTDAISVANALGAIVVTSAGNWRADVKDAFPAQIQDVVTVAATDENDDFAGYSNKGFLVDVAAPGGGGSYGSSSILSLLSSTSQISSGLAVNAIYQRNGNTSASAAFVSGVAALVLSANPALTREQVISIIKHSADDQVGNPAKDSPGYDPYFGWGRVNAARAVAMAMAPPQDPPVLKVPGEGFDFKLPQLLCGGQEWAFSLDIYNVGGGTLNWNIATPPWITPMTVSGSNFFSPTFKMTPTQTTNGAITVSSNGAGTSTTTTPVSVTMLPDIKLSNCAMTLATADGNQYFDLTRNPNPPAIPDGAGGAFFVWYGYIPYQDNYKVVMQHMNSNGMPLWPGNGIQVSSANSFQYNPTIVTDGTGGAIVLWRDGLNTGDNADKNLAAQRISSSGQLLWGPAGIAVTQTGNVVEPVITPDGSGGAIVAWTLLNGNDDDVYAQKISASGALLWPKPGAPVSTATSYEFLPRVAADGNGGAFFTWEDARTPFHSVYVQHLDKDGLPLLQQNGLLLSLENQGLGAGGANIVTDGVGGAIVAWYDGRNHPLSGDTYYSSAEDIYAARISGTGELLWQSGGVPIVSGLTVPSMIRMDMVSDGQQGAIISWRDTRYSNTIIAGRKDLFAQRINGSGTAVWAANGIPILSAHGWGIFPTQIPDGDGGILFAWQDERFGNFDIYLQQLKSDGSLRWGSNGVWIHSGVRDQVNPYLVPLGGNRLAIAWDDESKVGTSQGIDIRGNVVQLCTDHDGDSFYAEGGVCGPINNTDPFLTLQKTGTGQGSVESLPSGIKCGADCSRPFALGSTVTLKAVAAPNSFFSGWSGDLCQGTGECTVTLNANTTVTAIFTAGLPVKIAESSTSIYSSPQQAYNNAFSGNTIIAKAQTFTENLNLNLPVSVNLVGGYDADFTTNPDYTAINGSVTVSQGTITVDSIVIQ